MSTKRNPLLPLHPPLTPPGWRSRVGLALTAAAARGRFVLQVCGDCGAVQYPPREACCQCLSVDLPWREVSAGGVLAAGSVVRVSADPYFRRRLPWPVGLVAMDAGAKVVAHLAGGPAPGERVRLSMRLDKAGRGVMLAMPEGRDVNDDPILRELSCDPRGRRVLVTDGRHPVGVAMARAMLAAGAREVFVGVADDWLPSAPLEGVTVVPLDLTDQDSVLRAVGSLGGRVDILVNTALRLRPGGPLEPGAVVDARVAMEVAYFGALRLAQAFGPALRGRAEDGGTAWVHIVSVGALAPMAGYFRDAPVQAAALALAQSLRGSLRPVKTLTALVGPLDDVWHEVVPPPKVAPAALASAVVGALKAGIEDIAVGDIAQDMLARWLDNPDVPAREVAG
jgi:uncharacterized OB-fold protein/NAD(P)-dependent dehydrogenase (short-subunit alcohol dehydrogenase family)